MAFLVASTVVVASAGAAVDYSQLSGARDRYQTAADLAALAGAKEYRLGNSATTIVQDVTRSHVRNSLGAEAAHAVVTPSVDHQKKTVTVAIEAEQPTYVMHLFGLVEARLAVSATAKVLGGAPICVIGLDASANSTLELDKDAHLQAPECAVYSNSQKASGLIARKRATVTAAFICTAGGKEGAGAGSFDPTPQTDCPVIPDPLAERPQPKISGCDYNDFAIRSGSANLLPGTYCGGITASGGAILNLTSGVYVMKDGPLSIGGGATLKGVNVGFFFTGESSVLDLQTDSIVSLTAPATGDLAGMLFFEDRESPEQQVHQILSNGADTLLGTIYFPRNRFHVAADAPVAEKSAFTIVVVRYFTLAAGPTMVLNSNYGGTNVPVPAGLGPHTNTMALAE